MRKKRKIQESRLVKGYLPTAKFYLAGISSPALASEETLKQRHEQYLDEVLDSREQEAHSEMFRWWNRGSDYEAASLLQAEAARQLGDRELVKRFRDKKRLEEASSYAASTVARVYAAEKAWTRTVLNGFKYVRIYRGIHGDLAKEVKEAASSGKKFSLGLYPLSSWTVYKEVAEGFAARESGGVVLEKIVSIRRILTTGRTNSALSLGESEIVLESRPPDVTISKEVS